MKIRLLSLSIGILFLVTACKKETPSAHCPGAGSFVKQVEQLRGQVYYDSTQSSYFIRVPNSFDSYAIGYACNLANAYKKSGLNVEFSGSYYEYGQIVSGLAGNEYYYLSLDSVSLAN